MKIGEIVAKPNRAEQAKLVRERKYRETMKAYEAKASKSPFQAELERLGLVSSSGKVTLR